MGTEASRYVHGERVTHKSVERGGENMFYIKTATGGVKIMSHLAEETTSMANGGSRGFPPLKHCSPPSLAQNIPIDHFLTFRSALGARSQKGTNA